MGDISEWVSKDYQFVIDRCNTTKLEAKTNGKLKCKKPDEIDKFISSMQLDTWARYYQLDYALMTSNPTYKV